MDFLRGKVMLKAINPFEKFLMSMGTTIILISLKNEQLNMVMVVVLAMILFFQKISMKRLTFFFLPPLIFLIPTILAQGISFTPEVKFVFDKEIFFRVIASLMALSIFILTVNVKDFYHIGLQLKIPKFICEIGILMFNYLNIMYVSYVKIKTAMEARGAFCKFSNIYRDVALLFSKVFLNSYFSLKGQENAMYSRGYNDEIKFYPISYKITKRGILILALWYGVILIFYKVGL